MNSTQTQTATLPNSHGRMLSILAYCCVALALFLMISDFYKLLLL